MAKRPPRQQPELVIITGMSGSGKGSVIRALEDVGYYSVDNLPIELIPKFAELIRDSPTVRCAALVVDVREGESLKGFPALYAKIRRSVPTKLLFLEANDATLVRRFSETRRPHPLGTNRSVQRSIQSERKKLAPIRGLADVIVDTSKFNVHDLRETYEGRVGGEPELLDKHVEGAHPVPVGVLGAFSVVGMPALPLGDR